MVFTSKTTSKVFYQHAIKRLLIHPSISRSSSSLYLHSWYSISLSHQASALCNQPVCPEMVTQLRDHFLSTQGLPSLSVAQTPPTSTYTPWVKTLCHLRAFRAPALTPNCFHIFCIPAPDKGPAGFPASLLGASFTLVSLSAHIGAWGLNLQGCDVGKGSTDDIKTQADKVIGRWENARKRQRNDSAKPRRPPTVKE